jgi:quinol-cytochrome oxidoreductase complex cytochrome b subunit
MALQKMEIPSLDSLDKQLATERRKAWFINIILLIVGVIVGGVLGYFGVFDPLGQIIENLISR